MPDVRCGRISGRPPCGFEIEHEQHESVRETRLCRMGGKGQITETGRLSTCRVDDLSHSADDSDATRAIDAEMVGFHVIPDTHPCHRMPSLRLPSLALRSAAGHALNVSWVIGALIDRSHSKPGRQTSRSSRRATTEEHTMTEEQNVENTEDETTDDVEGQDAHEATMRPQRPILYLDEAAESDAGDL
jgi:hypothetical protein